MSDKLNEFAVNLPMSSVAGVGTPTIAVAPTESPSYDCTADVSIPAEVNTDEHKHINVYAESCSVVNVEGPCALVDMVLCVNITNPTTYASASYKIVKRLSLDKIKLALQAEHMTPIQVVEAEEQPEDPIVVEQEMAAFYARRRIQEMAGIFESNGKKKFKILFKYDDPSGNGVASSEVTYDAIVDKAHARHVFNVKIKKDKFKNAKIVRVTEVE